MAGPITWRSIVGPSLADAARPLQYAQQNFDQGFGVLEKALAQRQEANQGVLDRGRDAAQQGYLNALDSATTPEELQAKRSELQAQFLALDPTRQAAVRTADDDRLRAIYALTADKNKFSDDERLRLEAPIEQAAKVALYNGDMATVEKLRASNPEARFWDEFAATSRTIGRENVDWAHQDKLRPLDIESKKANIAAERLRAAAANENLLDSRESRTDRKQTKAANEAIAQAALQYRQNFPILAARQGAEFSPSLPRVNGLLDMETINNDPMLKSIYDRESVAKPELKIKSDTEAFRDSLNSLRQSGKITNAQALALENNPAGFNTDPKSYLVGFDKTEADRKQQMIDVEAAKAKENNSLFLSNKNAVEQIPIIQKQLKDAGADGEKIRIVTDELIKDLASEPDKVLHIPSILATATTAESFGLTGTWTSKFRGNYTDQLKKLQGTESYLKQMRDYRSWENGEVLKKREEVVKALNAARIPVR